MQQYFGVAKEEGISNEEIGAAQAIAMAVSAGKVNAQFREARVIARTERTRRRRDEPEGGE